MHYNRFIPTFWRNVPSPSSDWPDLFQNDYWCFYEYIRKYMLRSRFTYKPQCCWIRTLSTFSWGRETLSDYRITYQLIHTVPPRPLCRDQQVWSHEERTVTAACIMVVTSQVLGRDEVGTERDINKLAKSHHLIHDPHPLHLALRISFLLFKVSSWQWEVKTIVSFNPHRPDPQPPWHQI